MSVLDNEQIIDNIFINEILERQLAHIKIFLYNHSSHVIYKHCIGEDEWNIPEEFKYLPARHLTENGCRYEKDNNFIKKN